MDIKKLTIAEASKLLDERKVSSEELTKQYLERIDKVDSKVKAFLEIYNNDSIKSAKESDKRRNAGSSLSKLDGIPFSIKDLICIKDKKTTASSNMLRDFVSPYDATVIKKLKEAGVVVLGKTNLDAFAHGSSTENSDFQTTSNPWDLERVPGGSSGGSAASIASGEVLGSLGTDTGGSIRQPASLCSVVGLKPTYGRVSRYGVIAMASSLDVVGPLAKTAQDIALIMEVIAGQDKNDATTLPDKVPQYSKLLSKGIKGLKIGLPKEYFSSGMDKDVEKCINDSLKKLKDLGAVTSEISLPHTDYALSTYYILQPAEVSSNLSRYDGIKYGYSAFLKDNSLTLDEVYLKSRSEGFGDEAKRRIMLGTYVLSAGYFDAYYKKALKLRTLVKRDFENAFKDVDVIVTPVSPTPAFKIGEKSEDPVQMYLSDIYTVPINPAGVPAISTPAGFVERDNKKLPVGMQIIGPMLQEEKILNVSHAYETVTKISTQMADL